MKMYRRLQFSGYNTLKMADFYNYQISSFQFLYAIQNPYLS